MSARRLSTFRSPAAILGLGTPCALRGGIRSGCILGILICAWSCFLRCSVHARLAAEDFNGRNVVLFITDQERQVQYYPDGWTQENLPGAARLMERGITFNNAYTNSVTCSSSRACMLTGLMPAQHGVRYKLRNTMANDEYPQEDMPTDVANLATIAMEAGYTTVSWWY
jgi:hypothetical protein